jgi:GNAT superfamily N-acetyltransferase
VLVKEYWNMTNLFVAPDHQGRGIGRLLLEAAMKGCQTRSPRGALLLNSSTVACGFYEHLGFRQTGPGRDRPGGCVPYGHDFRDPT